MNRWSSARKRTVGPAGHGRLHAAHVGLRGHPRVAAQVQQRGDDAGREPRDDALAGRTSARRRCGRRATGRSRSPSVTVRSASSRRSSPVASSRRASKASRSRVSVVTSASVSRVIVGLPRSRTSARLRVRPAGPRTVPARRPRRRRGRAPRARSSAATISVAAHVGASGLVVRERLVGAEEAGHQPQRPGAPHHVLAERPPAYLARRARAGRRRRAAASGRPRAACSSAHRLAPAARRC